MKRIHIVGSSPRTGTTLMAELMVSGFEIDGFARREMSVFQRPREKYAIFCSKRPGDILSARAVLRIDPNLWIVHMVRDPRDVVVSRHGKAPDRYWTNLRLWKAYRRAARKAEGHPRFLTVRYEDLVREPDRVQAWLMERMPFLRKRADFSAYHRIARPSAQSLEAMKGVRPVTATSVGAWRQHKPRLAAQIALHGPIDADLIELGYEKDSAWMRELDGVTPDNGISHLPDHLPRWRTALRALRRYQATVRYALGLVRRVPTE